MSAQLPGLCPDNDSDLFLEKIQSQVEINSNGRWHLKT